jgi:hypothetical protein|tara:strand:+ start:861 stop:1256 length:396 start_codon:yes stop_codon:yes gene_type:complete
MSWTAFIPVIANVAGSLLKKDSGTASGSQQSRRDPLSTVYASRQKAQGASAGFMPSSQANLPRPDTQPHPATLMAQAAIQQNNVNLEALQRAARNTAISNGVDPFSQDHYKMWGEGPGGQREDIPSISKIG